MAEHNGFQGFEDRVRGVRGVRQLGGTFFVRGSAFTCGTEPCESNERAEPDKHPNAPKTPTVAIPFACSGRKGRLCLAAAICVRAGGEHSGVAV